MAIFKTIHITKYQYTWPIKEGINEIRLFPHNFKDQEVLDHQLLISHDPKIEYFRDYYGNRAANFNNLEAHTEMIIESRMTVRVSHSLKIPEFEDVATKELEEEKKQ
jgi:hypothetical protein